MSATREMPAGKYDALAAKAAEVGGVGSGRLFAESSDAFCGTPYCLAGIAIACGLIPVPEGVPHREMYDAVCADAKAMFGHDPMILDSFIERACADKPAVLGDYSDRAPFVAVMRHIGIVRGAA